MKSILLRSLRSTTAALLLAAFAFAGTAQLHAQNAVSNLGFGAGGTANIGFANNGAAERRVFSFTTGASAGGYDFSSFTLSFSGSVGSPGSLVVDLYSAFNPSGSSSPTGLVQNLSLTSGNLTSANNAVFSGSATLAASTTYYLFLTAPAATTVGNYYRYNTAATLSEDAGGLAGWTIGDVGYYGLGGNPWNSAGGGAAMSIQATASAIPEPSTYAAIAGAAMLGLAAWKRRRAPSAPVAS